MVYGLGLNTNGCLGFGHNNPIPSPELIPQLCNQNIQYFVNGLDFVLASRDGIYNKQFNEISAIGSGGFGTVFKVKHRLDDKIYAVKRVLFNDFSEDKKNKVLNEVKSLAKLDSEYVVKYYHSWTESHYLYIQMEFCSQSLKSLLNDKHIVFERQPEDVMKVFEYFVLCEIFKELLESVQYLHECKPPVIHRDLKPDNILIEHNVRFNRWVKLCDFGLATDHDMPSMSHTSNVGTSQYMSIEAHQRRYTTKADIYSLGVIAQHLFDLFNIENPLEKYSLTTFSANFNKLYAIIWSMAKSMAYKRPTSGRVLQEYNDWSINKMIYLNHKMPHFILDSKYVVKSNHSSLSSDNLFLQMEFCSQIGKHFKHNEWSIDKTVVTSDRVLDDYNQ
ncbi:unnamed protein product, partial [Medioppia subpectinata]